MNEHNPEMIIVIPCYHEPEVMKTIRSLFACEQGGFSAEIILLINSFQISSEEIVAFNRQSYQEAVLFAEEYNSENLFLTPILVENIPGHQTGAGQPRKIGMDEAIKHFKGIYKKKGIIVSLDADTTVSSNYLREIYKAFRKYKLRSATIQFHHPTDHLREDDPLRKASELYELYLRYYRSALEYTGFPYSYFTIGSAFAVTAETYTAVGGMGKQQAGEDFYFLHKVFPLGKTRFIDSTCVYPAARISNRVPFGTGPAIEKMMQENKIHKLSYQVAAFEELKQLFDQTDNRFDNLESLPPHLLSFLEQEDFANKVQEIQSHTSTQEAFRKRFFSYFTAFKILKYLNYVHPAIYPLSDIVEEEKALNHVIVESLNRLTV